MMRTLGICQYQIRFVLPFVLVVSASVTHATPNAALSSCPGVTLEERINCYVTQQMQSERIPGLSLSVVRNGEVVMQHGYGHADIEGDVAVTPETLFAIGSVTKVFTAIGVLQLVDRGLVRLNDPIGMYLQECELPNKRWKKITIRQLLAMTSGIPEYLGPDMAWPEVLAAVARPQGRLGVGMDFRPGAEYEYSNPNFLLLGALISKLSPQRDYETFIEDSILAPLGMEATRPNTVKRLPGLAVGYEFNEREERFFRAASRLPIRSFSSGWLVTNQLDMVKFERALHNRKLLSKESYEEMWTNYILRGGALDPFGLGWAVRSIEEPAGTLDPEVSSEPVAVEPLPTNSFSKLVVKNGGLPGYAAVIVRYMGANEELSVIVCSNASGTSVNITGVAEQIAREAMKGL